MYNISDGSAAWLLSQWNNFLEDTSEFDEYFLAEADKDDNIDNDVKTITYVGQEKSRNGRSCYLTEITIMPSIRPLWNRAIDHYAENIFNM